MIDKDFYVDFDEPNDEEYAECSWCKEAFPVSELMVEKDLGYLCDQCYQAILSRGEELVILKGNGNV